MGNLDQLSPAILRLLEAESLRKPVIQAIIQSLELPSGSRGLDAGCGIGLQARLLAEAVGAQGTVAGMDLNFEALAYGSRRMFGREPSCRISLAQGDAARLPFRQNAFDWAWSADCIGYPLGDLTPFLEEFKRVVKPGGKVVLLAWSSQQLLPGYPFLEARLNAASSAYLPYLKGKDPTLHFLRAIHPFREAGLEEVEARTLVGDIQAPLREDQRQALISLFEMLWGEPQAGEAPEDRGEYRRLCEPGSPDFILDTPGYYAFFTYTLFQGKVKSMRN